MQVATTQDYMPQTVGIAQTVVGKSVTLAYLET